MKFLDYTFEQIQTLGANVTQEISQAINGKETAFAFLKNPLLQHQFVPFDQIFQVVCIGGTNISHSNVSVNPDKTVNLLNPQTNTFGLLENLEILRDVFFDVVDPTYTHIVLNFAYPIEPFINKEGLLDGVLTHGTKEHQFNGLIDYPVGQTLAKLLSEKYQKDFKIVCANDVVCLTMAPGIDRQNYDQYISMVLGTGNNFGMFLDSGVIVNLESGNFGNFTQTESGKYVDENSINPGYQRFEKEVSGQYLYLHFNYYAQKQKLQTRLTDSQQLNDLVSKSGPESELANQVMDRSAALVAGMLQGIYQYKQHPLECVTEGSLFWKGAGYSDRVKNYLEQLGVPPKGIEFIKIDQSSLIGPAHLGTYLS